MTRIFLSYAHEDRTAAKRVVDALAREGFEAWWDHHIPPGRSWSQVIGGRVRAAEAVIVIWSKHSVHSNFVQEEAQLAFDAGKLLPVRIEDVEPPMGFRRLHAANLYGWRGESDHQQWQALLEEIRERLGATPTSVPTAATPALKKRHRLAMTLTAAIALTAIGVVSITQLDRANLRIDNTNDTPAQVDQEGQTPLDTLPNPPLSAERVPPATPTESTPAADAGSIERAYWSRCCSQQSASVESLEGYMSTYPNGLFARNAEGRLADLRAPDLAGTIWRGVFRINNSDYSMEVRFNPRGIAQITHDGDDQYRLYRWTQSGAQVRIFDDYNDYRGLITRAGTAMAGDYYSEGVRTDTFRLTRL